MPKKSKKQIAEDEELILNELLKDARQSENRIAHNLGFSRQKIWRIIKKLEQEKKIWGYSTIVDSEIEGYNTYYALCKSKVAYIDNADQAINNLKNNNSKAVGVYLKELHYVNGPYDWIIEFVAKNTIIAKKYIGYMQKEYKDRLTDVVMIENVFSLVKSGKLNPSIEKLRELSLE